MNYTFEHKKTGEQKTITMSLSEHDEFLKDNPDWFQVILPSGIVSGVGERAKPDGVFRDMLKEMKKANPGSTINDW